MPRTINPIALYHLYVRRIVALLVATIVLSVFVYGFFLLEAVSHAANQAQARQEISKLSSRVGHLQSQYLSATRALTPERARALGFVTPTEVAVVYATADGLSLSLKQ